MNPLARLQHRRAGGIDGGGGLLDRNVHGFGLEVEAKHRALALFRSNPDPAALLLGELAADEWYAEHEGEWQSEAEAWDAALDAEEARCGYR